MTITAAQVKELRERTGIGMMECKKALTATDGDIEKAIEELRKKGLAKAAKKADRETEEGGIFIEVDGATAFVLSISCETDFLAKSDRFDAMAKDIMSFLKENGADSKEGAQEKINKDWALELGENLQIKDYISVDAEAAGAYVHSNKKVAALVLGANGTESDKLKQVAMHVTATNPEYISADDISDEVVEKEKAIQLEIMKNDPNMGNKSDDVLLKIISGKMGKFKAENSLLEQAFVIDPSQKVKDFIGAENVKAVHRFTI